MNHNDVREKANAFQRKFLSSAHLSSDRLKSVAEELGYTVIRYDRFCSDEDVAVIAASLDIRNMLERSKGFTYSDKNYRLVFVNSDLSEEEAIIVFLHELGHVYLGHTEHTTAFGYDVIEEHAASEFVHYILEPSLRKQINSFIQNNRKLLITISIVAVVIMLGFAFYRKKKMDDYYSQEFYVTEAGKKYHLKKCYYLKGKKVRKLTEEEIKSGEYEPCNVCISQ